MCEEGQQGVARQHSEVLQEDRTEAPHELEEAALCPAAAARARLEAGLSLLDSGPELLLQGVRWLMGRARKEVVPRDAEKPATTRMN